MEQREAKLKFEYEQLLSIFDSIDEIIYVSDPNTYEILYANKAHKKRFAEDIVGKKCYEALHSKTEPCDFCTNDKIFGKDAKQPYIWEYTTRGGKWFRCIDRAIEWPDGRMVRYEMAIDITERTQAEELNRALANSSQIGVYIVQGGRFQIINPKFQEYTGFSEAELLGMESLSLVHPEDREMVRENAVQMLKGKRSSPYEFRTITKGGETIWTLETVTSIQYKGELATLGSFMDITEHKRMELKLRERSDELEKVNKELEDYTSIVSHDLAAPLRSIQSFTSFLIEDYGDKLDEQGRDYLERLKNSSLRMQQLIEDLLTLSRVGRRYTGVEMVDLNGLLEGVKDDLKGQIDKAGAEIIIHDLPTISTQRTWIGQLFRNLIDNALKYNESKLPRVEIEGEEREGDHLFKVKDNSIGIEEKYLSQIFNIFERLHPQSEYGGGTGVGLAICKRIVESWGGKIWVQSKVSEGSIFYFNIPKVSKRRRVE